MIRGLVLIETWLEDEELLRYYNQAGIWLMLLMPEELIWRWLC